MAVFTPDTQLQLFGSKDNALFTSIFLKFKHYIAFILAQTTHWADRVHLFLLDQRPAVWSEPGSTGDPGLDQTGKSEPTVQM